MLLAAFMASGYFPMIHSYLVSGIDGLRLFPLAHVATMEAFYLIGVIFYLTRFPESMFSETFDILVRLEFV